MNVHKLKIRPEYYSAVACGHKRAELRKNDRDYKVGDFIRLQEYDNANECYTLRGVLVQITDVCDVNEWAPCCVMLSIKLA